MILDMNGNLTTTVHKVCISNFTKDRFLSVSITGLRWTDNFNFASCFDSKQEALEFAERPYVHEFIDDVLEQYLWTDTRELVYENN